MNRALLEMFQECEDYEDELYQDEADSSLSDADSELQFRLYSQLHYSAENQDTHEDVREEESSVPQAQPQQTSSPPPAAPIDVIVIDSGPDAITLSDNTEEDDSVCAKKGQTSIAHRRVTPHNTHSLVPSRSQTRNVYLGDVVVLDSESEENSDSDSVPPYVEGLGSDSDSDGLENWMILGREKHEGDQNIQLNCSLPENCEKQEHVNDGENKTSWVVSKKDKEAQIYNKGVGRTSRRLSNRYYTNKSVTCHNCSKIGHLSKNCPTPKKLPCCSLCGHRGHLARTCPDRHCSNCWLPGHTFNDCLERAYWHKRCHRCGMSGHFNDACPEIWRQYHQTITPGPILESQNPDACKTPAYCYNCSKKGHFGFECSERRMYNGTYPTLPFVSYYDQTRDIRCREHRLKKKAKELQDAGLIDLPDDGAGSSTPQPPTKKKKTNYHTSLFRTPSQTNNPQTPKRRIAHTPKHHPQLHSTPLNINQAPQTPRTWDKNTPHSAFTPQEHSQKKAKRKRKRRKSAVIEEDADFPRGCSNGPHANRDVISPWTANTPNMLFGKKNNKKTESQTKKKERIWRKRQKNAARDDAAYAPDDLFTIKQRRSR
ncbi:zinc finger CCHC domain-containing protein 7 [Triplophysa rosa]|uniref:zinc finger CCHC domain-containing protein 7 n=1 Tax=Triplophysa rosa TaxID=992332 RepID=UPI002545F3B4|nr:zinc finger CCHC domain-containing protein 7 [Triplophysa rosa]